MFDLLATCGRASAGAHQHVVVERDEARRLRGYERGPRWWR